MSSFQTIQHEHFELARPLDLGSLQPRLDQKVDLTSAALSGKFSLQICCNGSSTADTQHITAGLVGNFIKERRPLIVPRLSTNTSIITVWGDDVSFDYILAGQVQTHGVVGGALWAISPSGCPREVPLAAQAARSLGMKVGSLNRRRRRGRKAPRACINSTSSITTTCVSRSKLNSASLNQFQ